MFENIRWLFFDVGSTIIDERQAYRHRLKDIADAAGVDYDSVLQTAVSFYQQNLKGDRETARQLNVAMTKWHVEDEILYADAAECLEKLSERYGIGIIANQSPGTAERLKRHGVLQYIDLIVASAEEGVAKPDRRIFEIALERSGGKPEHSVMIGDRIDNDVIPAKALGMRTIWLRQGFGRYWTIGHEAERPDCSADSLTEVCRMLL